MPEETPSSCALPLEGLDAIVAIHNIAGASGVLNAAGDELENMIFNHYAARGIDHLPYLNNSPLKCYVITADPEGFLPHARYRQEIAGGMQFTPIQSPDDLPELGVKKALYLPYIRLQDDPLPESIEWLRYGLPPYVTIRLKDKAFMHNWLNSNGFAHYLPNFIACDATYIPRFGMRMLRKIADMLDTFGMRDVYPLGLVIRGALSDGNYAMAIVVEAHQDMVVRGRKVLRGQFMLKPNGKSADMEIFETPQAALQRVLAHIRHENNPLLDDRVVMSRLLDLDLSPGLCTAAVNGEWFDFAFNGQYMEPGNTACTGTSTFSSAVGAEVAAQTSTLYLQQAQNLLRHILQAFIPTRDAETLYAMLNMDVMVVGELEKELYRRAQNHPENHPYLQNIGQNNAHYAPRIYPSETLLFAEINPRDTNWTIAMKAVLQALHRPCTVENLQALGNGGMQILARDHWDLPPQMEVDYARDLLLQFHGYLAQGGEGFIMRMADNPAGVIIYTPSPDPQRLTEIAEQAYTFLLDHSPILA